jgi:Domain of unknown function (DUF4347)/Concanavalin A-like lectin/glucanases superfamily
MMRWLTRLLALFAGRSSAVRKPVVEEIEPRILYSADVNPLLWAGIDPNATAIVAGIDSGSTTPPTVDAQQQRRREIIFVDPAVTDSQTLVDALIAQRGGDADIEVVQLRADADGLAQIDAVLAGEHGIDALHIISHGEAGRLQLGNGVVDSAALQANAASLTGWQQALNADADILLFGCNVGEGAQGAAFISRLAALTGADVAASVDATGATTLGGDWELEASTGAIETAVNAAAPQWQSWQGRLDITTGLIGRWRFDVNATDSSGTAHNGTLANGALIDTTAGTNRIGIGKLSLDGVDDRINLSAHIGVFSSLTQGTISAWIKTSDTLGVIYEVTDTTNSASYAVFGVSGGKLNFEVRQNGTDSLNVTTTASVNDNNWHHVAVTVGPSGNTLYIDGVAQAVNHSTGNAATQRFYNNVTGLNAMEIGINRTSGGSFAAYAGLIDDARFYNRALTSVDVAQLHAFTGPGIIVTPASGLVTTEAGGTAQFSVVLNDAPTANVNIPVSSSDTTEGTVSTTLLTFTTANWNVAQTVTVTGVNDALTDGLQAYTAVLGAATSTDANYSGRDAADVQLANSDDDITYNQISVDTAADTADGDTSSLLSLAANRGADGLISLREAIIAANNTANGVGGADRIVFNIAGTGVHTISLTSALPTITGAVTIDATTDDSFAANGNRPAIELNGAGAGAGSNGLTFNGNADNSAVRGLVINRFGGSGIDATGSSVNPLTGLTIVGNYIGTNIAGDTARGNIGNGISLYYVSGATIGGTVVADQNLISGNGAVGPYTGGINIGSDSSGVTVAGNLIGVNASANALIGNVAYGILVDQGAHDITIGGTTRSASNVIDGSTSGAGVEVTASGSNPYNVAVIGNVITGNSGRGIDLGGNGVTANDAAPDGDTGPNGLQNFPALTSANANSAGTTIAGTLNSNANTTYRIEFYANRPTVADASNGEGERYLGFITVTTDGAGTASVNATLAGVWVNSGDRISATATVDLGGGLYGATSEFAANVTASSNGIIVVDTTSDVVDGTTTSITNLGAARGADGRISLREAVIAANNTANGGTPDKIVFAIPVTDTNHVYYQNNGVIGTFSAPVATTLADAAISDFDADYAAGTARSWYRITLGSADLNVTQALVIDGSTQAGYDATKGPVIEINAAAVSVADPNAISLTTGASTVRGLVINGAGDNAIEVDAGAGGSTIVGNYIGTDVSGTLARANSTGGIWGAIAIKSNNVVVGGTTLADRNLISGNAGSGIELYNSANGALILGNTIGTTVTGIAALGNATAGIDIHSSSANNTVGGIAAGQGNVIAFNGGDGVSIVTNISGNVVRGNSIHSNTGLAIDLNNDGVTANDVGDGDAGPNALKNFPVLTAVNTDGGVVHISGSLNTTANATHTIDFYSSPSADGTGYGEGATYLGSTSVTTDGAGNVTFSNITFAKAVPLGHYISAVTVDLASGNTSEFSASMVATNAAPVLDNSKSPVLVAQNEDAGAPVGAVGTLVSSLVDFATPAGQVDNITDADSGAQLGIAVTAANSSNGAWWTSTDNGATWSALGAVANNSARLLAADANTRLYFQANANYNGTTANAITFRAWDRTSGANGGTADASINGSSTAFSTATDTASLAVTAVNDAPAVTTTGSTLAFTENGAATAVDGGLALGDIDNATLSSATVSITANFATGQDILAFTNQSGISGNWNAASGVLTLTGSATLAQYQAALRSVTYINSSDGPSTATRTVSFVVNDGSANSNTGVRNISVAAVNDAPTIGPVRAPFINEIHYDNSGADSGEAIEITAAAGTDLTGWSLVLYNGLVPGAATVYDTKALTGVVPNLSNGYGVLSFSYPSNGIQNGGNDAIALVNSAGTVVQFLSYEGVTTAADGPAAGLTSTDIGVAEDGFGAVGNSMQLSGTGPSYIWVAAAANSFGAVNAGQGFASLRACRARRRWPKTAR